MEEPLKIEERIAYEKRKKEVFKYILVKCSEICILLLMGPG